MLDAGDLLLHLEEQTLAHEVLKVLSFKVLEHSLDVTVFALEENLAIAETANRPLGVCVDPQDGFFTVRNHACCLQECAVSTKGHNKVYIMVADVLRSKLVALLCLDVATALPEGVYDLLSHCDVHVCGLLPVFSCKGVGAYQVFISLFST